MDEQESLEAALTHAQAAAAEDIRRRLESLAEVLGQAQGGGDALSDFWDDELAAGRVPDLDMTLDDLRELERSGQWRPKK